MENMNQPFQPLSPEQAASPASPQLQPMQFDSIPEFTPITADPEKNQRQHHIVILFISGALALTLAVIGTIIYVEYQPQSTSNTTVDELKSEIATLDPQIEKLSKVESEVFTNTGFSSEYFEAADKTAKLKAMKTERENLIEELSSQKSQSSILASGAIWLFIAAFIVIIAGIAVFLFF